MTSILDLIELVGVGEQHLNQKIKMSTTNKQQEKCTEDLYKCLCQANAIILLSFCDVGPVFPIFYGAKWKYLLFIMNGIRYCVVISETIICGASSFPMHNAFVHIKHKQNMSLIKMLCWFKELIHASMCFGYPI